MDSFQNFNNTFDGFGASPDGLGATVRMGGFGDDALAPTVATTAPNPALRALQVAYMLAAPVGAAIGAYHGYKRTDSVGWAIGWSLFGGLLPILAIPIALAQGIGERE